MANAKTGNAFYADTAGVLKATPTRVFYVTITATSSNGSATLVDAVNGNVVLNLTITQHNSITHDYSASPIFFPGGVEVSAISHAVVTIVYNERGG